MADTTDTQALSNAELYLQSVISGESDGLPTPRSREEQFLKHCVERCGCDGLPNPRSRREKYLYALAEKIAQGGGSGGGETAVNTLNEYLKGTKTDIAAEDLAGATEIRGYLFYGDIITSAYIPDSVTAIGQRAFCTCKNLTNLRMSNNVKTIGGHAFEYCTNLENISLPEGVTSIGERAFYSCESITSIIVPDSVVSLSTFLCGECSNLVTATIGNNVGLTGQGIFQKCSKLNSVTLGNSVSFVSANSFDGCASLSEITLPSSVKTISTNAFLNCTSLMEVVCLAETPPTLSANSFNGVPAECIFRVKPTSVEAYKSAPNWIARADYIVAIEE